MTREASEYLFIYQNPIHFQYPAQSLLPQWISLDYWRWVLPLPLQDSDCFPANGWSGCAVDLNAIWVRSKVKRQVSATEERVQHRIQCCWEQTTCTPSSVVQYLLQQRTERVHTSNPLAVWLSTWPADHSTTDENSQFLLQRKLEDPSSRDKKTGVRLAGHWYLSLSRTKEFTLSPEQKKIKGEKLSPNYEDSFSF